MLEVLITLVILGLLLVVLTDSTRFSLRALQLQGDDYTSYGDFEAVDRTVRALIARADPGGFGGQAPLFLGTEQSLSFTTTLPDAAGALSTREADVTLIVDRSRTLQLRWLPHYRNWIGPRPLPKSEPLLEGVERIDIRYWLPDSGPMGGSWQTSWKGRALPELIRIRIVLSHQTQDHWPDIVAAPLRDRWQL